jgi:hypothetical protein
VGRGEAKVQMLSDRAGKRKLIGYTLKVILLHACIAAFNPFFSFVLTSTSAKLLGGSAQVHTFSDVHRYYDYATQAVAGNVPYRDYVIEYPPLSFPLILLPRLVSTTILNYAIVFVVEMLIFDALAIYLIAKIVAGREGIERVPGRLMWYTLFLIAAGPIVFARFDLAPMALALAAMLAWFTGRNALGGTLAGIGTLVKIFPAVIAAPAMVAEIAGNRLRRYRGSLALMLTAGLGAGLWLLLGSAGAWASIEYHLERGLEIESLYSGLLILIAKIAGNPLAWTFDHGSFQLVTAWSGPMLKLAFPLQAVAMLVVTWRFYRSGMTDYVRYCAAAMLAFILTGKVLSPQYLIWLLPFVTLLRSGVWRKARLLFLSCCLLSTAIYPWAFAALMDFSTLAVAVLNLRNALLLGLFILLLFGVDDSPTKQDAIQLTGLARLEESQG